MQSFPFFASLFILSLVACGSSVSEDGNDRRAPTSSSPAPSPSSEAAQTSTPAAVPTTTATAPTEPPSPPAESKVSGGICTPGGVCGGLNSCSDKCFGDDCCELYCGCDNVDSSAASARLTCSLYCK